MIFDSSNEMHPRVHQIKRAIDQFIETGESGMHSQHGVLLCHILNHCRRVGIPFELTFRPGGYYVKRLEDLE